MGFFGKWILQGLFFFHRITGNYGVSIIFLSLIIQLILLPLSLKSFKSNIGMKKIQPIINNLKIKYKDDQRRFQEEMFQVYKQYKVNPFGGCLPLLLQMPIFIALYTTLLNTYELRNASFLWINDLSNPETGVIYQCAAKGFAMFGAWIEGEYIVPGKMTKDIFNQLFADPGVCEHVIERYVKQYNQRKDSDA